MKAAMPVLVSLFVVAFDSGAADAPTASRGGGAVLLAAVPPDTVLFDKSAGNGREPQGNASIQVEGDHRIIRSNGMPDHQTGSFPNRNNPNRISPQAYTFRVPAKPKAAAALTPLRMQLFGVAVNGVVFDPFAAEWWRGDPRWQYEPLGGAINLGVDDSNAHVQPTGAYHYHAIPTALVKRLTDGKPKMALVGWAADGFPIYGPWGYSDAKDTNSTVKKLKSGYRVRSGARPGGAEGPGGTYDGSFIADYEYAAGSGDLDECNGRVGVTPEFPEGTYYYVLTGEWPFVPRYFKGTPDRSFMKHGPGPGGPGPGGPGGFGPPGRGRGFPPPPGPR